MGRQHDNAPKRRRAFKPPRIKVAGREFEFMPGRIFEVTPRGTRRVRNPELVRQIMDAIEAQRVHEASLRIRPPESSSDPAV